MGWKNIKTEYRIEHIVHVTQAGICIGSPYINDLIVISLDGQIVKRHERGGSDHLARYQQEMDADPEKLKRLIETPDTFEKSLLVYTYDGADIIEKRCEELGYPNVTHDGLIMYDNTFSADKNFIVARANRNAAAGVELFTRNVESLKAELDMATARLANEKAILAKLEADYPA